MPSPKIQRPCQRKGCHGTVRTTQNLINKGHGLYCGIKCSALARSAKLVEYGVPPRKRPETFVPKFCTSCGQRRGPHAKGDGMCRTCSSRAWGKRGRHANAVPFGRATMPSRPWAFASDSKSAQAERAMTWTESDDRPRVANPIRQGTVTPYGKVAAAGLNEHGRYYMVIDVATGAITQMPADVIEAGR
jgi:hypothetical protein